MVFGQIYQVFELQKDNSLHNVSYDFPIANSHYDQTLEQHMCVPSKGEFIRDRNGHLWKVANIVTDVNDGRVVVSFIVKPTKLSLFYRL